MGSSVKVKCGFYGHRSSNSIFFLASIFFSLDDKPPSVILDCYHRLILVLISVWLTTPSALEDKVIHVCLHSPSCFASFNTCCHEPCFAAVSFLHCFLRGIKPKSCFFWESREQILTRLARSVGRALSTYPSPSSRAPRSVTLSWCWEFTVSSTALDFFWNHTTCFLWVFFSPLCEPNKPVLQSAADQHTYFPCNLLKVAELSLFVWDSEGKN